jgi:phosphatidylserine/phosphatidylglycerophosphate/cardiolipin synthase-like enzyme
MEHCRAGVGHTCVMLARPISRLDDWVGGAVETAVRSHHGRRLTRLGREAQLDPPKDGLWAAGDPPPRDRCELELLVDGEQAFGEIARALGSARSHVHIAGWHIAPDIGLRRDERAIRLRDLLAELAGRIDVRVLLWAGAPLHVFTPDRSEVREARRQLVEGTAIRCALDSRERPMHCHHEKLVVVDDEVAFVGGIDLTTLGGDRFDTSDHPMRSRLGWHDACTRLRGPAVADVAAHFAERWREAAGEGERGRAPAAAGALDVRPGPAEAGAQTVQVVRTVPERIYDFAPRGEFRILEAYRRALRSARRLIYIEKQFLWSPHIVEILAAKLRNPPDDRFRLVVLLPSKPNNGADSTRGQLGVLAAADADAHRFLAATVSARTGALTWPLYVHAKVAIVDDGWLTVGSANLNDHSLFNDTEMNVICCDENLARDARLRLWSEHLELPREQVSGDPTDVVDRLWRPLANEELERRRRGEPARRRLTELAGVSRRSKALLGPLNALLVDG